MQTYQSITDHHDGNVLVYMGDDEATPQPCSFACCPQGIQLYTKRYVSEMRILDIRFRLPGAADEISCSGVVVRCQLADNPSLYRIWVKFLDLPESSQQCLCSLARETN